MADIDFVMAWVDGADPAWRQERDAYAGNKGRSAASSGDARYRDWELLRFWFRGVERFAPWVRRIHFVTWGHLPEWLDTANPKLTVVNHRDFIPQEYLPTFSANPIELNFHRIQGLSEQFVYFNDDVFLLRPVREADFFRNGKPRDMLALQPVVANREDDIMPYIYLNDAMLLAKYFDKRDNMRKQPGAYFHPGYPFLYFGYNLLEMAFPRFTGFYTVHGPAPLLKSTYETVWQLEPDRLDQVCRHRFRSREDVNQYVLREWQKLSGNFAPCNASRFCRYFNIGADNGGLLRTITGRRAASVCINDSGELAGIERARQEIQQAFERILPEKSSFER